MDLHAGLGDHGLISRHGFRHRPHIRKALDRFGFVGKIIDVQVKYAVEVEDVAMQVSDGLTCFRQHGIGLQYAAVNFHKVAIVKRVVPARIPLLDMNVAVIGDEQGLFLQGFVPGLFKGAHLSVKIVNHLVRRNPDIAQAFLELGRFLSRGPTGDVAERVVRSVDAVMVGDDKGDALGLDLPSGSVGFLVYILGLGEVVHARMGQLVKRRLERLGLAHAFLDGDFLVGWLRGEVTLCSTVYLLEGHGAWGNLFDCLHCHFVFLDVSFECFDAKRGNLAAGGLADIENVADLETLDGVDALVHHRISVVVKLGLTLLVNAVRVAADFLRCWGDDLDGLLALVDLAAELARPGLVTGNKGCFGFLHSNQDAVVDRVAVELAHNVQVLLIATGRENIVDSCFQAVQGFLQFGLVVFACVVCCFFCHDSCPFERAQAPEVWRLLGGGVSLLAVQRVVVRVHGDGARCVGIGGIHEFLNARLLDLALVALGLQLDLVVAEGSGCCQGDDYRPGYACRNLRLVIFGLGNGCRGL